MTAPLSVAIVGAGLGGLAAGVKLKEAGFDDFVILEKEGAVGGTWRDNRYPGCCCDVPVAMYQFSFAPSLSWSHIYPRSAEVQRYAEDVTDMFGLRPSIRLNDETTRAEWDDARAVWKLTTAAGKTYVAKAIVAGLGQLNRPYWPAIEGSDSFKGEKFHSARWNDKADLKGKRVAVIGSAASAVQLIPEVAKEAAHLVVFQRTPNWVAPRMDRAITDEEKALLITAPHVAAMGRQMVYEQSDYLFWQAFAWTKEGRDAYTRICLNHLADQVPDAELRARLTPDYPVGCKRILFADDFYPALLRDNVTLETDGIARITPAGIETKSGALHEVDVIIYATGFETTGWKWSMDVIGKGGVHLNELWADHPEAYLGITVSGFPNMFVLYGPNTNLGHNSITFMLERQVEYAVKAMSAMRDQHLASLEVTRAAQDAFNTRLQGDLSKTTWADPHCKSWYKTADGRITQNWGSHTRDYAAAVAELTLNDYVARPLAAAE